MGPLIVTKDTARKAIFAKLNRGGGIASASSNKRMVRRGLMTRGNSFVGFSSGQRVVVKARYVKHKAGAMSAGGGAASLRDHLKYISRNEAGKDGEKAVLFNDQEEGLDRKGFLELCQNDRHHWRFIISPENGHDIEDFHGYVRGVMKLVEKDLQTSLTWTAAVHYDTDDVHAHVIVRGVNDRGEDLVIGQDYVKEGFRRRAQEVATELLGERSLDEIRKSQEKEVEALRVTSLDRFMPRPILENPYSTKASSKDGCAFWPRLVWPSNSRRGFICSKKIIRTTLERSRKRTRRSNVCIPRFRIMRASMVCLFMS